MCKKVRQAIQRYMIHKKMSMATPSLVERYYLQGALKDLWSLTNEEWKIISKDDPHKNWKPITFHGNKEAGTDQKGETKYIMEIHLGERKRNKGTEQKQLQDQQEGKIERDLILKIKQIIKKP